MAGGDQQARALYEDAVSPTGFITVIAAAGNRHVVTMDKAGAYLNASMSSVVVHVYFEPAQVAMLCELVSGYKKFIMSAVRMLVKLNKTLYACI